MPVFLRIWNGKIIHNSSVYPRPADKNEKSLEKEINVLNRLNFDYLKFLHSVVCIIMFWKKKRQCCD